MRIKLANMYKGLRKVSGHMKVSVIIVLHYCGTTGRRSLTFTGGGNIWEGRLLEMTVELGIGLSRSIRLREFAIITADYCQASRSQQAKVSCWHVQRMIMGLKPQPEEERKMER